MTHRDLCFLAVILGGVGTLAASLSPPRVATQARSATIPDASAIIAPAQGAAAINQAFRDHWRAEELQPAPRAPELAVVRRLALALGGTIPALEAIRQFEARPPANRLAHWIDETLRERRTSDYLAERLARAVVGTEGGPRGDPSWCTAGAASSPGWATNCTATTPTTRSSAT